MIVKELKEKLENYDPDSKVCFIEHDMEHPTFPDVSIVELKHIYEGKVKNIIEDHDEGIHIDYFPVDKQERKKDDINNELQKE